MTKLALVLPCYNEEEVLPTTIERLLALKHELLAEQLIDDASTITFVDDGSRDRTWQIIEQAAAKDSSIHGIKLAKNRGHQNALIAGLLNVDGDAVISVDADLQDDLGAIREMVREHAAGAQIVYGIRSARDTDTWFKRWTAESFYRVMRLVGVDIVFNHADYRLMSRAAIEALAQFDEVNLFLCGIIPQLGFRTAEVRYARAERYILGRGASSPSEQTARGHHRWTRPPAARLPRRCRKEIHVPRWRCETRLGGLLTCTLVQCHGTAQRS